MLRALLVDDETTILSTLAKLLERDGFSVVTASSAAAGRAALAKERIDIVLTDLRMESPLAGLEVVRTARELVPRPVIVILTAYPVPRADWTEAGADALIVKGMNPLAIPKQLKALLTGGDSYRSNQ